MAAKSSNAQKYVVNGTLVAQDLAKAGAAATFEIRAGRKRLGIIEIGQGSFRWKNSHSPKFKRIPWDRLAEKLNEL